MNTLEKLNKNGLNLTLDDVNRICEKYMISELSVFGSAIRDDFDDDSDVDILISFNENSNSTIDDILDLKDYFTNLFNRDVDIVESEGIRNPIRKMNIMSTKEVLYAV